MQRSLSTFTETQARHYLERLRWPQGVCCVHCQSQRIKAITGGRKGLYQCNSCQQQFTVTVGSVMEGSHLPLRTWVLAAQLINASKKGVSALQLQRMLGLGSYKTTWHLAHRLRKAMAPSSTDPLLSGTVEVDETFIGGHCYGKGKEYAATRKTPLVAMVVRHGGVRTQVVPTISASTLKRTIEHYLKPSVTLMTDERSAYGNIAKRYGKHFTVNHSKHEYVRGTVHTNTVESFFALLKRGIHGSFHHVSRKHLSRYADEFGFRWTHRHLEDRERTEVALTQGMTRNTIALKELTYHAPTTFAPFTLRRE